MPCILHHESLAQSVEHLTFNQRVDSSSLSRLIKIKKLLTENYILYIIIKSFVFNADLAQLAEHLICNQRVGGSNPLVGTIYAEVVQW